MLIIQTKTAITLFSQWGKQNKTKVCLVSIIYLMLSLNKIITNSVLEQTCCFILSYDVGSGISFMYLNAPLSLDVRRVLLYILRQLSLPRLSNPRIILQDLVIVCSIDCAIPRLQNRAEHQGSEDQSPSPAPQNWEHFRHSPQDLEISWMTILDLSSRRPTSSCCPVSICANPPSPSTLLWRELQVSPAPLQMLSPELV